MLGKDSLLIRFLLQNVPPMYVTVPALQCKGQQCSDEHSRRFLLVLVHISALTFCALKQCF